MNEVVHTSPTIGSNVEEIVVKNTHFLMWDIGGQESLRSSWNTYYSNTEVRNTFCTLLHFLFIHCSSWGEPKYCPAAGFLPERGSWCVCSEHRRQQGPPPCQRSAFHKGARLQSKVRVSLRIFFFLEKSEKERGRCVGENSPKETHELNFPDVTSARHFLLSQANTHSCLFHTWDIQQVTSK